MMVADGSCSLQQLEAFFAAADAADAAIDNAALAQACVAKVLAEQVAAFPSSLYAAAPMVSALDFDDDASVDAVLARLGGAPVAAAPAATPAVAAAVAAPAAPVAAAVAATPVACRRYDKVARATPAGWRAGEDERAFDALLGDVVAGSLFWSTPAPPPAKHALALAPLCSPAPTLAIMVAAAAAKRAHTHAADAAAVAAAPVASRTRSKARLAAPIAMRTRGQTAAAAALRAKCF